MRTQVPCVCVCVCAKSRLHRMNRLSPAFSPVESINHFQWHFNQTLGNRFYVPSAMCDRRVNFFNRSLCNISAGARARAFTHTKHFEWNDYFKIPWGAYILYNVSFQDMLLWNAANTTLCAHLQSSVLCFWCSTRMLFFNFHCHLCY